MARYNLACVRVKAAERVAGASGHDAAEPALLRREALDALRRIAALYTVQLETATPAARGSAVWVLRNMLGDDDLDGVRSAAALARLPADEQSAFTELWAELAALLRRMEERH